MVLLYAGGRLHDTAMPAAAKLVVRPASNYERQLHEREYGDSFEQGEAALISFASRKDAESNWGLSGESREYPNQLDYSGSFLVFHRFFVCGPCATCEKGAPVLDGGRRLVVPPSDIAESHEEDKFFLFDHGRIRNVLIMIRFARSSALRMIQSS